MSETVLRTVDLYKRYGDLHVLQKVSLEVAQGEVVVILGPSGCGKSTLLRCMNGLEQIQSGEIWLGDENIAAPGTRWSRVRQRVGMVFQSYDLFPHLTVLNNVLLGPLKVQKRERNAAVKKAEQLLERVGLADKKSAYPRQLSGGQKQRVAIVRALMMDPEVLLLDEITAALDPEMVREVLEVVLELAATGMTMVIVTHEMAFAKAIADRVVFIDQGRILEITPPGRFFAGPQTDRARQFLSKFSYEEQTEKREVI